MYAFDPGARGKLPVELMKDAAERFGYIVVGSNNSRNGSWKIEAEAAEAKLRAGIARIQLTAPTACPPDGLSSSTKMALIFP